jgi:hypothetical protein
VRLVSWKELNRGCYKQVPRCAADRDFGRRIASQASAQSDINAALSSDATGHELPSEYGSDSGRHARIGQGALATVSMTTDLGHAASCPDKIAELRQTALRNHQTTPETISQARGYAQLMFAADLTLAEAQDALGNNDECLLAARRAEEQLQAGQTAKN